MASDWCATKGEVPQEDKGSKEMYASLLTVIERGEMSLQMEAILGGGRDGAP